MTKLYGNLQKADLEIYTALSLNFLAQEVSLFMLLNFDPTGGDLIVLVQFISGLLLQHAISQETERCFGSIYPKVFSSTCNVIILLFCLLSIITCI